MSRLLYLMRKRSLFEPIKYGAYYNFYAATDSRNVCSSGWHVMTLTELNSLITYLGGSSIAGQHLKEQSLTYWPDIAYNDNSSLFNLRGTGYRGSSGGFTTPIPNTYGTFWTATPLTGSFSYSATVKSTDATISTYNIPSGVASNKVGQPLRLVCDSGSPTTYTGNDGTIYRTVTINGVTYTADNIAETKFRNGDWIHGFDGGNYTPITNTNWAALTTAGMCFYNDNPETYK